DRVIKMCLIHDLGEAVTGDVPAFWKTASNEREEESAVASLLATLPTEIGAELAALFAEMKAMETPEARLYKALDNIEALISHNEAPISTWLPREYEENLTYGEKNAAFSPWTQALREAVKQESIDKIKRESK
ncbi:MAG: HD domain-containing protein, partial [Clostridia bacterium]|nr:HD domain-containing protein [Clostridia bacterium]